MRRVTIQLFVEDDLDTWSLTTFLERTFIRGLNNELDEALKLDQELPILDERGKVVGTWNVHHD